MDDRRVVLFAGVMLLPVLAVAQIVQRPPLPPPPPAGAAPAAPGQPAPQGLLQPPPGMPAPEAAQRHLTYEEWAKWYYQTFTIPKDGAILLGAHRVRPNRMLRQIYEIVGEVGDNYLVRNLPPEDPESLGFRAWVTNERIEIGTKAKAEYLKDKYIIVNNPDLLPPFTDRLRFVAANGGLPKGGRWQISFDIADMNGDGLPDLIFPPERTGNGKPSIFLQQKDHSWRPAETKWPTEGIKLDYGTVRVADFDGDGHEDIAIACHFGKTYVLYGDGKGAFTRFVEIPQTNPSMTARALTVADFNNDGRPDLASYAEIDLNMTNTTKLASGLVNIALNLPSGWKAVAEKSFPAQIMGDALTSADIDMDGKMDLLLTSRSANSMELIFRNLGGGEAWQPIAATQMPVYAYALATAAGPLDRFKQPDVVSCFEQHNPWKSDKPTQACIIYRFHDAAGVPTLTPTPTVLFQEKSQDVNYKAVAIGDIDGDGRDDIVIASNTGRVRVFLQGADGTFYEQLHPGMDQPGTDIFDVRIADLYHDGKGEIVFMGAPVREKGGGVWVYQPEALGEAQPAQTKPARTP